MSTTLTFKTFQAGFIDSIILFLIGIYFIQLYAKEKRWSGSRNTAFRVSILWLIIDIPFKFLFLYILGNNAIFIPLRIAPEIIISSFIVASYYEKEYLESLTFMIIIQIIFFVYELRTISYPLVLLFLIGVLYLKWHFNLKSWENPFFSAFIISSSFFLFS